MKLDASLIRNCPDHGAHLGQACPRCKIRQTIAPDASRGVDKESKLHAQIKAWCANQWPRWVVVSARMDVPSTLPVGCHDMTIFAPPAKHPSWPQLPTVFCFELKKRGGKLSAEQRSWIELMRCADHTVHVIDSFDAFLEIVK